MSTRHEATAPTPDPATQPAASAPARTVTMRAGGVLPPLRRMGADAESISRRVTGSPNYRDGRFRSPEPTRRPTSTSMPRIAAAAWQQRGRGKPVAAVPVVPAAPPAVPGALAATWYGHASTLVELDGRRFLLDPVFGHRASPVSLAGPERLHPTPGSIAGIPTLDAVVISHDHYDHLDEPSVAELERTHRPHYVVPIGVDQHLLAWGVPADRVTALDWWDHTEVAGIRLTCTPARHNSGRGFVESQTLWAGWALRGPEHAVFFAGDSGESACFAEIGERVGPFDLTIVPVGAYDEFWHDIHMNPPEAVAAHVAVNTSAEGEDAVSRSVMLPVHWATFNLARHWWSEPVRWLRRVAPAAGVTVAYPLVGARVDLDVERTADDMTDAVTDAVSPHQADWWTACAAPADRD